MKILCRIFGHKWIGKMEFSDNIVFKKDFIGMECKRCLKREEGDRLFDNLNNHDQ